MKMPLLGLAVVATVLATAPVVTADQKLQMKDLPPAVQKAVQAQTSGAEVKGLSKEVEHGQTFYEAETIVNGHSRDLLFDAAGQLVEVEEGVALDAVPAPVRTALERHGRVLKVESVTKKGVVTYEAQVERNGKKREISVDATGKTPAR